MRPFNQALPMYLLTLYLAVQADQNQTPLLSTWFTQSEPLPQVVNGKVQKNGQGLLLGANARIRFALPPGAESENMLIRTSFMPLIPASELISINQPGADCLCSFKIGLGRYEVELSDKWVRVQRYDTSYATPDTILADKALASKPGEVSLAVFVVDNIWKVVLESDTVLQVKVPPERYFAVDLAGYRHPFEIYGLHVEAVRRPPLALDPINKRVLVAARFHPARFMAPEGFANHHLVVVESAKAALSALFTTSVSQRAIDSALSLLGSKAGNNLAQAAFTQMYKSSSRAAAARARGTPISVGFIFGDSLYRIDPFIRPANLRPAFVHVGNAANREHFGSGDILTLHSSPAALIANSALTMHDLATARAPLIKVDSLPFAEEKEVTLVLEITTP